jgi:hypothetical protein
MRGKGQSSFPMIPFRLIIISCVKLQANGMVHIIPHTVEYLGHNILYQMEKGKKRSREQACLIIL